MLDYIVSDIFVNKFINTEYNFTESCSKCAYNKFFFNLGPKYWDLMSKLKKKN